MQAKKGRRGKTAVTLLIDDHPVARQGMECILRLHKPTEEIAQASSVKEAIDHMCHTMADLVFVDINLNNESGFEFVEWLREKEYPTKVFMITSSSCESDYRYAQEQNVDAYLLKEDFIDDILYGIRVVERGGKFYSPAIISKPNVPPSKENLIDTLTEREREVHELIRKGYSNAQIGKELFISEGTTKRHVTSILSKLGVKSRMQAMLFTTEHQPVRRTVTDLREIKRERGVYCEREREKERASSR